MALFHCSVLLLLGLVQPNLAGCDAQEVACLADQDPISLLQIKSKLVLDTQRTDLVVQNVHGEEVHQQDSMPSFDIDLDEAPEKRWLKVAARYRPEMIAMAQSLRFQLGQHLPQDLLESFLKVAKFGPEYEAELKGLVSAVSDPAVTLDSLKMLNMLYEVQSPVACAGVLWAMSNGTVMHGRNMDYSFHFKMADGSLLNLPNVTFYATFQKAGKGIYKSMSWPGYIGVHTGMRFGGWSFEQNTRSQLNEVHENLRAAKAGGEVNGLFARKTLETVPTFKDAVAKLLATKFIAPQYFILAGAGQFEGAVLTIDRLDSHLPSTPPVQKVSNSSTGWHLVQTNDDIVDAHDEIVQTVGGKKDVRRPIMNYMLSGATQDIVGEDHLMEFMHTPPLFWENTVFSTVMVPSTNYFKTVLPYESSGPIARELFAADTNEEANLENMLADPNLFKDNLVHATFASPIE